MLRAPTGHNASPPCQRRQLRVGQIAAMNHHVNPSAAIIECNKTACPNGSRRRDLACQNRRTVQEPSNNPSRKEKQKQNDTTRTVVACSTIIAGSKRPISARNIHVCRSRCHTITQKYCSNLTVCHRLAYQEAKLPYRRPRAVVSQHTSALLSTRRHLVWVQHCVNHQPS